MGVLEGRVALVTGGGRGIGRAVSELFAAEGAAVAVNYRRDKDAAGETVATIRAAGGTALAVEAPVDDVGAVRRMVDRVVAELGPIGIAVNNAGIASRGHDVADTDPAELERVVGVHAFGAHHVCQAVLPSMRTLDRGDIVFVSSIATRDHSAGGAPYAMGKAAAEALAATLAREERRNGIRVNVIAPGLVVTEMGRRLAKSFGADDIGSLDAASPFGHVLRPEEVARVALFLCSPHNTYVTGERLYVDGRGA
jgi:3-oxoacyl-[acyl-carrier protein] reductase